jgi:hypothetical protein
VTTPFSNQITGPEGILNRPQIQSPNFSIAAKTGWAIYKNGNAYFFNITAEGTVTATAFIGVDFNIGPDGAFFYSGPPGAGNLAASIATAAGDDPYANPYDPGFVAYGPTGNVQLYSAAINFNLAAAVLAGSIVQIAASPAGSGVPSINLISPANSTSLAGASQAVVGLLGQSEDETSLARIILGTGQFGTTDISAVPILAVGGEIYYAEPGAAGGDLVAETWHALTPGNGWTNSGSGPDLQYRMLASPPNTVEIIGDLDAGTLTNNTTIATVPHVPASTQAFAAAYPGTPPTSTSARLYVDSGTGVLACSGMAGLSGRVAFHTFISLDA